LASVTLRFTNVGGGEEAHVNLFSDNAGVPGSSLLAIGNFVTQASSTFNYTVAAPSAFTLQAGTTYWLETEGGPTSFPLNFWRRTLSTATTGPGTLGAWATAPSAGSWTSAGTDAGRLQIQVDGTAVAAVPEPSGLALLAAGAAGLLGWRC